MINRVTIRDNKWGGLDPDGKTWNGLVGMLIDGEIDMASAGLSLIPARARVVDFSVATGRQAVTLSAPRSEGRSTQFWVYLDIFPLVVWVTCIVGVVLLAAGFYLTSKTPPLTSLAMTSLLVLQLDIGSIFILRNMSSKILYMSAAFLAYLIYTYYTCDLTARMTSGPPPLNIRYVHTYVCTECHLILA